MFAVFALLELQGPFTTSTIPRRSPVFSDVTLLKMTLESDAVAGATIELLEARLRRLAYLLTGATEWTGVPITPEKPTSLDETISRRLARLERELDKLRRSVPAVRDVIQLRMYKFCVVYTGVHPCVSTLLRPVVCTQLQELA